MDERLSMILIMLDSSPSRRAALAFADVREEADDVSVLRLFTHSFYKTPMIC